MFFYQPTYGNAANCSTIRMIPTRLSPQRPLGETAKTESIVDDVFLGAFIAVVRNMDKIWLSEKLQKTLRNRIVFKISPLAEQRFE